MDDPTTHHGQIYTDRLEPRRFHLEEIAIPNQPFGQKLQGHLALLVSPQPHLGAETGNLPVCGLVSGDLAAIPPLAGRTLRRRSSQRSCHPYPAK